MRECGMERQRQRQRQRERGAGSRGMAMRQSQTRRGAGALQSSASSERIRQRIGSDRIASLCPRLRCCQCVASALTTRHVAACFALLRLDSTRLAGCAMAQPFCACRCKSRLLLQLAYRIAADAAHPTSNGAAGDALASLTAAPSAGVRGDPFQPVLLLLPRRRNLETMQSAGASNQAQQKSALIGLFGPAMQADVLNNIKIK